MPGKIKVKVLAGRNLPVMDRAGDTTDAFVEIKFGGITHKTDVCRKSLNPHWNSTEWYRFEVDEAELQDEPLQLRLMDHDTYSANDAIGKVVISLAPLLAGAAEKGNAHSGAMMSGWIPVFDTMHGIRGELNIIVKVELFTDFNKYKTSSCGVQFFHSPMIPPGFRASAIHGFVEELIVNDDPEYQWIDKIRTPRASNEARQVAFIKLSNQVQRLVGVKAAELGANAVVGYQQDFDLEGEEGVVARAIGTAVSITPLPTTTQVQSAPPCSQQIKRDPQNSSSFIQILKTDINETNLRVCMVCFSPNNKQFHFNNKQKRELKKYLGILATGDDVTDLNQYFQSHQEELGKLINILHPKFSSNFLDDDAADDDDKGDLSRQCSVKSYNDNASIFQDDYVSMKSMRAISDDQTDLNKLLNKTNEDYMEGPLAKIKKLKKTLFTKRISSTRSRKAEKNEDTISIQSNSSDTSKVSDKRLEIKRFKRPKIVKLIKRNEEEDDEGTGMASILARSILHAHTSLACIKETQDSEHSPSSTMRRTSESEPNISIHDEEIHLTVPDTSKIATIVEGTDDNKHIMSSSLKNINSEKEVTERPLISESCPNTPKVSRSDNKLSFPGETSYFGSVSSALSESSEMYSSSEADDDESDPKTDTDKSIETTTSIVQSVRKHTFDSDMIAQMDRKLSILEGDTPEPPDESKDYEQSVISKKAADEENIQNSLLEESTQSQSTSNESSKKSSKRPSMVFKFHNPFSHKKSVSAPASPSEKKGFIHRSSEKIKRQWSKISKSNMVRSISHTFLHRRKSSQVSQTCQSIPDVSKPGSATELHAKTSRETVLGSPFLSYTDLQSLDKETQFETHKLVDKDDNHGKVEMYIGSEPTSRASLSGPSSPYQVKDELLFHEQLSQKSHKRDSHAEVKPTGLIHTAMQTILIDKVQSLLIPATPETENSGKSFFDDLHQKLSVVEDERKDDVTKEESPEINQEITTNIENKSESAQQSVVVEQTSIDKNKKLIRQDSIHSINLEDDPEPELPTENIKTLTIIPKRIPTPVLQHFHPILCGVKAKPLETIPSLPESSSLDRAQSIDTDGVDTVESNPEDPNSVINTHAECSGSFDRSEKEVREVDGIEKDGSPKHLRHESYGGKEPAPSSGVNASLNATSTPVGIHRRSSDSDLSITPKAGSLNTSVNQGSGGGAILRPSMNSNNLDMLEYPFLTMTKYPPGFIVHLGGCVTARAVKLLEGVGEARAAWWSELRTELRAHARAARCHAVLAYRETATICEEVCVLSASGTAAVINLECDFSADPDSYLNVSAIKTIEEPTSECLTSHVPYAIDNNTYRAELATCYECGRSKVPAVLLATCAKPSGLSYTGKSILLTACAARIRRAPPQSEPGARDISDQLPFLEYELHKLLLAKLRMQGANAIFELTTQLALGARCVTALAYGTAYRLNALPPATLPIVKATDNDKMALEIKKSLLNAFNANKTTNGYDLVQNDRNFNGVGSDSESTSPPVLDLSADKDACILELDETEDVETARWLAVTRDHMQMYSEDVQSAPGSTPQYFAQIWRARLALGSGAGGGGGGAGAGGGSLSRAAARHSSRALAAARYKLRRLRPNALANAHLHIELPEDEIQLVISGTAIPLKHTHTVEAAKTQQNRGDDSIFTLDEEQRSAPVIQDNVQQSSRVLITTLPYVSGVTSRRVCALRSLFVRETTAVREMGGMSGFLHTFHCEVLAIVRANTAALGGNALTSYNVRQLMLQDNAHKNQGQCLLSVGGDVVYVTN